MSNNERFNVLIGVCAHLRAVLKYDLSDSTLAELESKLNLATSALAEIVKKEAVIH